MLIAKNNPKVSVIIPTYNRAHLIGRAIKSVLNQTYKDFEIIIVDDGSTDKTEEVVKDFKDERVRYIRREKNKGGSAARNTGIKAARGEYIAFQDSDDEWLPEKLEKQMKAFEAMAMAKPVIATKVSDLPEILDRCGWIVEPENPEQLAKTIQCVLNNPKEGEEIGRKARQKCIEKYSWDAMEKVLLKLFEKYE